MSATKKNTVDIVLSRISHDAVIPVRVVDNKAQAARAYRPYTIIDSRSEVGDWVSEPLLPPGHVRSNVKTPSSTHDTPVNSTHRNDANSSNIINRIVSSTHPRNGGGGGGESRRDGDHVAMQCEHDYKHTSSPRPNTTVTADPLTALTWQTSPPMLTRRAWANLMKAKEAHTCAAPCTHTHSRHNDHRYDSHTHTEENDTTTSQDRRTPAPSGEDTTRPDSSQQSDAHHSITARNGPRRTRSHLCLPPSLLPSSLVSLPTASSRGIVEFESGAMYRRPPRPGWAAAQRSEATVYGFGARRALETRVRYVADDADMHWCAQHGISVSALQRGFSMLEWAYLLRLLCVVALQNREDTQSVTNCLAEMSSWYGGAGCGRYASASRPVSHGTGHGSRVAGASAVTRCAEEDGQLVSTAPTKMTESVRHGCTAGIIKQEEHEEEEEDGEENDDVGGVHESWTRAHLDRASSRTSRTTGTDSHRTSAATPDHMMGMDHVPHMTTTVLPEAVLNFARRVVGLQQQPPPPSLDKSSARRAGASFLSRRDVQSNERDGERLTLTEEEDEDDDGGADRVDDWDVCALCSRPVSVLTRRTAFHRMASSSCDSATSSASAMTETTTSSSHSARGTAASTKRSSSSHTSLAFSRPSTPLSPRLAAKAKAAAAAVSDAPNATHTATRHECRGLEGTTPACHSGEDAQMATMWSDWVRMHAMQTPALYLPPVTLITVTITTRSATRTTGTMLLRIAAWMSGTTMKRRIA